MVLVGWSVKVNPKRLPKNCGDEMSDVILGIVQRGVCYDLQDFAEEQLCGIGRIKTIEFVGEVAQIVDEYGRVYDLVEVDGNPTVIHAVRGELKC